MAQGSEASCPSFAHVGGRFDPRKPGVAGVGTHTREAAVGVALASQPCPLGMNIFNDCSWGRLPWLPPGNPLNHGGR